jgi:Tfp pilus assembly protein PilN
VRPETARAATVCASSCASGGVSLHRPERTAWLGNDEAHYVKRWQDHDLEDLKQLLDLTEHSIAESEMARKYKSRMPAGRLSVSVESARSSRGNDYLLVVEGTGFSTAARNPRLAARNE